MQTRSRSSSGKPDATGSRLATSTEAGNRLYQQAVKSRSTGGAGTPSEVPVPTAREGSSSTDVLCAEIQRLRAESASQKFRLEEMQSQVNLLESSLETLRREQIALKNRKNDSQMADVVRTIRDDVNRLMEAQGNALGAPPAIPVTVEEVLSRVNPRLERLENVVNAPVDMERSEAQAIGPVEAVSKRKEGKKQSSKRSKKRSSARPDDSDEDSEDSDDDDSSTESSEDDSSEDYSSSSDEGDSRRTRKKKSGNSLSRLRKGPTCRGLKRLTCTNPLYRKLTDYRYYRLRIRKTKRSGRETGKVKDHIRRLRVGLDELTFDGKDPILIFEFLSRFVVEANTLRISEAQAFVALPHFLRKLALEQYRAVSGSLNADEGGVTSWPEAVQYLLRSYATSNAIRGAILDLRDVTQKDRETEVEYSSRLNNAAIRCGNVHSMDDKMTLYVDGLDKTIKSLVARHRERHPRIRFLELIQFAQAEGDAVRARSGMSSRTRRLGTYPTRDESLAQRAAKRGKALYLESPENSRLSTQTPRESHVGHDDLQYLDEPVGSIPTTELPSTESLQESELMAMEQRRYPYQRNAVVPPPGGITEKSPGWVNNRLVGNYQGRQNREGLICYSCYARHHLSAECTLSVRNLGQVILNYEALSEAERARVPANSYWQAKAWVTADARRQGGIPKVEQGRADAKIGNAPVVVHKPAQSGN